MTRAAIVIAVPELPEIEHLRRTLAPWVVGARALSVRLRRRDVVRIAGSRRARRGVTQHDLLEGDVIRDIIRRGKSLAFIGASGRVLVAHMGMTGSMRIVAEGSDQQSAVSGQRRASRDKHVHCEWVMEKARQGSARNRRNNSTLTPTLSVGRAAKVVRASAEGKGERFRLTFRDPRRFGGLWPFASMTELLKSGGGWSRLGPDAFDPALETMMVRERLERTSQPMKAALLNQALLAGVGNIYADEALFAAGIHPARRPATLERTEWTRLTKALRRVLERAVAAGGSSVRDYVDAAGENGMFALELRVYGRAGEPCVRCGQRLRSSTMAQRTTVFCVRCQRMAGRRKGRR